MRREDDWVEYALSMADDAERRGSDLSLVAARLEGLSLDRTVEELLRGVVRNGLSDDDAARASKDLYGELCRWLLEFMVAASYVRRERGLTIEELADAFGRWTGRLGRSLPDADLVSLARSVLVKSLLNDAKPFLVARTRDGAVDMVEAPLLIRVERERYRVTDEAENYLYHLDSTIDSFASDYSLAATRLQRELDSRHYDKSGRTVAGMVSVVGHARILMAALVEEMGRLAPDDQAERLDTISGMVEEIRKGDEAERRYREEVDRIWNRWLDDEASSRHIRDTHGEQLNDLRLLSERLRMLDAAKSWMYDEYATLAERCEEATRHYLRSGIVSTLFSLDDLLDEVARADLSGCDALDLLLLPATRPMTCVPFGMPPMATLDDMVRNAGYEADRPAFDLAAMTAGEEVVDGPAGDAHAEELARGFASWLAEGGALLSDWLASRDPYDTFADMESHALARLVSSLLADGASAGRAGSQIDGSPSRAHSFADASWLRRALPDGAQALAVRAVKTGEEVPYWGTDGSMVVRGTMDGIRFEVVTDA